MAMERYANLGGDSNVVCYELGADFIRVQFGDGSVYRYTGASAGSGNIATMQALARAGKGLNSFINTNVKFKYAAKER